MIGLKNLMMLLSLSLFLVACGQDPDSATDSAQPEHAEVLTDEPTAEPDVTTGQTELQCRLTVGWDPWEPYHFAAVGGEVQGLDIELITILAGLAGCELDYQQGSWASLLHLIRTGDLDLLLAATQTSEREAFARFSEPYRQESFHIFVRFEDRQRWSDMTLEELLDAGFRLGVTQDYVYGEAVSATLAEPRWRGQLIDTAVGELNFLNLMDHRIDGFIEDPFVAASIQHRRDWGQDIEALDTALYNGDVRLMFSRQSTTEVTVARFNQALAILRASGLDQQILDRYLD